MCVVWYFVEDLSVDWEVNDVVFVKLVEFVLLC